MLFTNLSATPSCVHDAGTWCAEVYQVSGSDWLAGAADWLVAKPLKILLILIVAIIVRWLARRTIDRMIKGTTPALLRPLKDRAHVLGAAANERRRQRAKTVGSVLKSVLTFVIFGLAVILILGELGVDLAPILASAGVAGVALGFGAQNLVKDFLSGMFMMVEDQYGVGDIVDIGPATGTVEAVGLRVTTLRDNHGTVWYVRNGEVLRVGNSSQGYAVAVVDVPVGNDADIDEVLRIVSTTLQLPTLTEELAADVLAEPELLGVESVTAESITVRATVTVRAGRQWVVQRRIRAALVDALNDAGIKPPQARFNGGSSQ